MGFANVTALKKFVLDHESAPLADVATAINITLRLADEKEHAATNQRLQAGRMLGSLRKRVEADGQNWSKFAKDHFDRSRRDIEKVMRLANADDPEAAAASEREKNNAAHKIARSNAADVRRKHTLLACRKIEPKGSPTPDYVPHNEIMMIALAYAIKAIEGLPAQSQDVELKNRFKFILATNVRDATKRNALLKKAQSHLRRAGE